MDGRMVSGYDEAQRIGPGAFWYQERANNPDLLDLWMVLPDHEMSRIEVGIGPDAPKSCWQWDGNRQSPTVTPSIRSLGGSRAGWHGWLRAGKFMSC